MQRKKRVISFFAVFAVTVILGMLVTTAHWAQAQTLWTRHVREAVINGQAQSVGRLPATQSMRLVLVLPLRHQPELENFLRELYDPSSPSYRRFLTVEEFTARFGPSHEDYDAVIAFAETNGFAVAGTSRNRMIVQITGTVASVEKAFHLTMGVYEHPAERRTFFAPDREPTVDLAFPLWHISGLDNYSIPRPLVRHRNSRAKPETADGSCPGGFYCGSDMRAAYYGGTSLDGSGQSLGLAEFYGTNLADLKTYYKNAGQTLKVPITLLSVDGTPTSCNYPSCDDALQTADMTQALGMAPSMSSLVMYIGSAQTIDDVGIFNAMATANPLNAQLSCSWYWTPADPQTLDPIFQEFATQGQTLFDASGSSGDWQYDGSIWPADDVYLVSAGGTDLVTQSPGGPWASEIAWADGGGGISPNDFAIPWWQVATAAGCSNCSQIYRNGPDVAAESNWDFYLCYDQSGCSDGWGGTAFASSMWAGYMALVNQQAVANGYPVVGFINPALYAIGMGSNYTTAFHDITSGNNGYPATTGYDPATGWGSPNGVGLINALASPQPPSFSLTTNPNTLTIAQGSSGTSTIAVFPWFGFNGSVTLSASGLPGGVTAGFAPNPTTTTSTLTLTVGAGAPAGTSIVTITGVSGSLTTQTTLTLTVVPAFQLIANPAMLIIAQGNSGTSTITVVPSGGFTGSVTLSASGLPSGVTAGFNPNPTATTSTLTLTVGASAPVGSSTVTITGVSGSFTNQTTIRLTVTPSGPIVSLSPKSLTFSKTVVGVTSKPQTVTLTNTGVSTLNITSIATSGDFAIQSKTCGATLAPNANCTVKVTFTPTQAGTRSGALTFTDNAPDSPQSVALSGTGIAQATLTPASATFAKQKVGTTSKPKTFTLTNNQSVTLSSIAISTTGDFAVSATTCGTSLAAKKKCTISVTFTPTQTGTRTGQLIVNDSASNSPQTATLKGTGY